MISRRHVIHVAAVALQLSALRGVEIGCGLSTASLFSPRLSFPAALHCGRIKGFTTTMSAASDSSPELLALQEKLKSLTEVGAQLHLLRRIPTQLVKLPDVGILQQLNLDTTLADNFQLVKHFASAITSERVQGSLSAARASEQKDKSDLVFTKPREHRKRKYGAVQYTRGTSN